MMLHLQKILFPGLLDSTEQLYYRAGNAATFDAALDARKRHRQYERAAAINAEDLTLRNVRHNFDLRERGLCLANDLAEHGENRSQGWRWRVFPVETIADRGLKFLAALLTVNGNLLPACCRRDGVGFMLTDGPIRIGDAFLRKQVLVINPYERTAALRTFSCREFLTVCLHNARAWLHYLVKRRKARAAFRREYARMTSMRFRRSYLGMRVRDHEK